MTAPAPPPLTPSDCDLRSYDWFPFFHKRLRQSAFWKRASDQACRISVDFWSIAYEQVPAASLPDDDYLLAEWAGFGRRNVDAWRAAKTEVLGPWVKCADGRWYHPVLSEVACKAWSERRVHLWKRECERLRKENARRAKNGLVPLELPEKPTDGPCLDADSVAASFGSETVSSGNEEISGGTSPPSTASSDDCRRTSGGKQVADDGIPAENALKGTETVSFSLRSKDVRAVRAGARAVFDREFWPRYPHKVGKAPALRSWEKLWREMDGDVAPILCGLERYIRDKPADREWLNPATFLNQRRFEDEPARLNGVAKPVPTGPRIDFGGGNVWLETNVRSQVERWRNNPRYWPTDRLGPPPGAPGCKVPKHLLEDA